MVSAAGCGKDIATLCAKLAATANNRHVPVNKAMIFRYR
jgi:hypothetical protein